ncbi:MAG: TetR/AcrR family transcriptional regulator [Oscillospiraceae bacterium]|nr:TetR/AcrR family transcriptional regulator [Oscillospiraceae bacterium]
MNFSELSYNILGKSYPLPLDGNKNDTKSTILLYATLMFAQKGYSGLSLRDLANSIGIQAASLYNHFPSKEKLWEAVIEHAEQLYLLYFGQLDAALQSACSFEEVLEVIVREPVRMANKFTCFAFTLISSEQFYRDNAWEIFNRTFLDYSVKFIERWFRRCVDIRYVEPFDTRIVAEILMQVVLNAINMETHSLLGRSVTFIPAKMIRDVQRFILGIVKIIPAEVCDGN